MATQYKSYRFRMRPTAEQEKALILTANARRWVWNWALQRWNETYAATGRAISASQLSAELTAIKCEPETEWLRGADAQSLQQAIEDLRFAFNRFFQRKARHPKFKSKKRDRMRFRIPQRVKLSDKRIYVPKAGWVRIYQSAVVDRPIKSTTFRQTPDGRWYASVMVEFELPDDALQPPNPDKVVGVDLGLRDFTTLSDGSKVAAPKFYRKSERRIAKACRRLSRRKPGSNRREAARKRRARVYQKVSNQRADFLHKLTTDLVRRHDGICIENLAVKALARTKLSKAFADAMMGEFRRQITYKTMWQRKHLAVVDRFFPSTKMCCRCGAINEKLRLSDRQWTCGCGARHDRDINAAVNIRDEGLRIVAVGHPET